MYRIAEPAHTRVSAGPARPDKVASYSGLPDQRGRAARILAVAASPARLSAQAMYASGRMSAIVPVRRATVTTSTWSKPATAVPGRPPLAGTGRRAGPHIAAGHRPLAGQRLVSRSAGAGRAVPEMLSPKSPAARRRDVGERASEPDP